MKAIVFTALFLTVQGTAQGFDLSNPQYDVLPDDIEKINDNVREKIEGIQESTGTAGFLGTVKDRLADVLEFVKKQFPTSDNSNENNENKVTPADLINHMDNTMKRMQASMKKIEEDMPEEEKEKQDQI